MVTASTRTTTSWRPLPFAALRVRNYRIFFVGQLVSVSGTWMESVAQAFLVLQLTDSGSQLGLVTAARFGPMFLLGPWGGMLADRLDDRKVLLLTQPVAGLISLAYAALIATHVINLPLVYLLSLGLGFVSVLDNPARQSLIPSLVPRDRLLNAVSLNSVTMNVARILGAAFGGVLAAGLGLTLCFLVNALSFMAVVASLLLMRVSEIAVRTRDSGGPGQVRAGFDYVRRRPDLAIPLLLVTVAGVFAWEFPVSLPLMAERVFHGTAATYGSMTAAMGLGGVFGGLVAASRNRLRLQSLALAGLGWGAAITVAALAPNLVTEYVVLVLVGYGSITFNSAAKTTLQLRTAPALRGRVMSLWGLAWLGSTPLGSPIIGAIGEHLNPRYGLLVGGVTTAVVSLAVLPRLRALDRIETAT